MRPAKVQEVLRGDEVDGIVRDIVGPGTTANLKLHEAIERNLLATLRSKAFEGMVTETLKRLVEDVALECIAARQTEIEEHTRRVVAERFDAVVRQVAEEQLSRALAEVRARFARGDR